MKICVLTHTFPKYRNDTTAAFMHPFVMGLKNAGNSVTVLTPFHTQLKVKKFPYKIFTYKYIWPKFLHRLGYSQTLSGGMSLKLETYILAPFLYFFAFFALLRILKKEQYDILSSHWILPNGFIAYLVSLFIRIPYTVTLAGSDVFLANKNNLFMLMAKLSAQRASLICADSPQYLKELARTKAKIRASHIIPYPVDTTLLHASTKGVYELKKKLRILPNTITILGVGRLIHKKGFEYLIKAFYKIHRKKRNVVLVIVGSGDLERQLRALVNRLFLDSFVRFVGNVERDKISAYYNLADIFVMPSIKDEEGNIDDRPVALLEAIATGLPVVATNFPGNALSIKDGVSGLLIPPKNVNEMSTVILRLIESRSLRESMSREAKKIVHKQLNMMQVGKRYTSLFKRLAKHI